MAALDDGDVLEARLLEADQRAEAGEAGADDEDVDPGGAGTGGGTVVRGTVPPGALALSAGPVRIIERWALDKRAGTAQAKAAQAALDQDGANQA